MQRDSDQKRERPQVRIGSECFFQSNKFLCSHGYEVIRNTLFNSVAQKVKIHGYVAINLNNRPTLISREPWDFKFIVVTLTTVINEYQVYIAFCPCSFIQEYRDKIKYVIVS